VIPRYREHRSAERAEEEARRVLVLLAAGPRFVRSPDAIDERRLDSAYEGGERSLDLGSLMCTRMKIGNTWRRHAATTE